MIKIVFLSDTHGYHRKVSLPEGDWLIHGGDYSSQGREPETKDFINWFASQTQFKEKIFIAGNHDKTQDPKFNWRFTDGSKPKWLQDLLAQLPEFNVTYLENNYKIIDGLKIWGSPISPWFHGDIWGFNKHRGDDIQEIWNQIPLDTDIILTHTPVKGKCDLVERNQEYAGCENLLPTLWNIKPMLHMSGHLHTGYGINKDETTTFVNGSLLNDDYQLINLPWIIEIDEMDKKVISVI